MIKIDFEFDSQYGVFRDALHLPDDHGLNHEEIQALKQQRFDKWMANRYWVGGAGTWNTASTANWSASSGGASGASAPTAADDIFFDQAGTYTVTVTAGRCQDITVSAGTVTFTGVTTGPTISGSMSLLAGTVWSIGAARTTTFNATTTGKTITTNGVSLSSQVTFDGVGGGWTLGSALTLTQTLSITNGSFNSGNYNITTSGFSSSNSNTRSISLGSSTVTISIGLSTALNLGTTTGLTWSAGTSQINLSGATTGISSGGLTFNNVSFTNVGTASVITITGANTFNTLSFVGRTNTGVNRASFTANQTISTLTLNAGTTAAYRTMLQSDVIGTPRTLAVTTLTAGAADYDFRDIVITGAAAPLSVTRAGDCKGNSGITFPAAKTVYYRQTTSANWGSPGTGSWSLTSGGALDATAFPLAQDTAVFPAATYPASGSTTTIPSNYNIGTIDMSLRTANTMTLATTTGTLTIYGNWINGTGITLSGTSVITFCGIGSQTITSAGRTFTQAFTIDTPSGSVTLQDNLVASQSLAGVLTVTKGTFDAVTFNVTLSGALAGVTASGTGTRTIAIGSGTWSIAGTTGCFNIDQPHRYRHRHNQLDQRQHQDVHGRWRPDLPDPQPRRHRDADGDWQQQVCRYHGHICRDGVPDQRHHHTSSPHQHDGHGYSHGESHLHNGYHSGVGA